MDENPKKVTVQTMVTIKDKLKFIHDKIMKSLDLKDVFSE